MSKQTFQQMKNSLVIIKERTHPSFTSLCQAEEAIIGIITSYCHFYRYGTIKDLACYDSLLHRKFCREAYVVLPQVVKSVQSYIQEHTKTTPHDMSTREITNALKKLY